MNFAIELLTDIDEPGRFEILLLFFGLLNTEAGRMEEIFRQSNDPEACRAAKKYCADALAISNELMKYAPGFPNGTSRRASGPFQPTN